MKIKKNKIILIVALVMLLTMILSACNKTGPIDSFYKKLKDSDSGTVTLSMEIPILGKMVMILKFDGNKQYTSAFYDEGEEYRETIDDRVYVYTKNYFEKWEITLEEANTDLDDNTEEFKELFNAKNYTYSKKDKSYTLKKDATLADLSEDLAEALAGMEPLTFKMFIDYNSCTIEMEMLLEGYVVPVKIEFSKINKTTVTLPKVS